MKVADLQQHLTDLRRLLEKSGVKGTILTDLEAIGNGLGPFRERSLREFADFLIRAEGYLARGEVPIAAPRGGRSAGRSAAATKEKAPSPDVAALTREAKRLYDQATDPATTVEMVRGYIQTLGNLTKAGLVTVATALELKLGKSAKKDAIIAEIERRILDRKGSWQRAGLLDRPVAPTLSNPGRGAGAGAGIEPATVSP